MARGFWTLALALVVCGCAANSGDESMVVLSNSGLAASKMTCTLTGDSSQPVIDHGEIFLGSTHPYVMTPLVQSRITANSGQELQRTITVQGAHVQLSVVSMALNNTVVSPPSVMLSGANAAFDALFSGTLGPGATANFSLNLIPVSALASIRQQASPGATDVLDVEVQATVTIYGKLGGGTVKAQPFTYPVTVCNATDGSCVVFDHGACPLTTQTPMTGNPCNPYQDGSIDCCDDATSGAMLCPGPTM